MIATLNPAAILRRLPGPVRLLVFGTFVNRVGSFILPFLTLVMKREFGLSDRTVGLTLMAYGVGSFSSVIAGGWLTDALGRRATLAISLIGSGTLAIGMGLTRSMTVFSVLLVAFGFLAELYRPAASAIVGDLLPSSDRAVGYAAMRMAINLGFAVGMVVGGLLADWSWRALFIGDGITTLGFGAIVLLFIADTRPPQTDATRAARAAAPAPWTDPVLLLMLLSSFCFSMVFFADFTIFPLTVTVSAGYPTVVFGALAGLNGLLIALFEMSVVQWVGTRYRRLRVASLGALLTGIGFGGLGLGQHWALYLVCVLIWTFGEILTSPLQMAFVSDWAPVEARGRYMAAFQSSWMMAVALNPVLLLPLHTRLGEAAFWPLMAALCLVPTVILYRLDRIDVPDRLRGRAVA